ncbi:hypothetical protein J2S78_000643 [Salibacterium salarium]|uniref:YjfB family protein n=1 Tax=Salibacterium salarium TaxID=284579 RepID=UPI0027800A05|nr:YjfB family protein [Salibacterium salarium]MDQ0298235.1 hypothetical protein [Salibacterium salarium]
MDVGATSIALSTNTAKSEASVELMSKAKDVAQQQGDFVSKMMNEAGEAQRAAQPHLGGNIDTKL